MARALPGEKVAVAKLPGDEMKTQMRCRRKAVYETLGTWGFAEAVVRFHVSQRIFLTVLVATPIRVPVCLHAICNATMKCETGCDKTASFWRRIAQALSVPVAPASYKDEHYPYESYSEDSF